MAAGNAGRITAQAIGTTAHAVAAFRNDALGMRSAWVWFANTARWRLTSDVRIADKAWMTIAQFTIAADETIGILSACTLTTQFRCVTRQGALSEWIANGRFGTVTYWVACGIARCSHTTWIRFAWIFRFDAAANCVRALDVARQTGTFGKTIAQMRALCVWTARRWFAWCLWWLTWHIRWRSFVFWQTEAIWYTVDGTASTVRSAWVRCAFITFGNCKET